VIERSSTYIKIWFWPRDAENVPAEVKDGAYGVTPDNWVRFTIPDSICPYGLSSKRVLQWLTIPTLNAVLKKNSRSITSSSI